MSNLYAVIMAGGSGTRFWPASRLARPKQFLPLAGASDEPLIASTVRRIRPLCSPERVLVVTAAHLVEPTLRALPDLPRENVLAEPCPRNTAPCVGWAAAVLAARDPDAVMMVLPSDHHIADEVRFREVLARAVEAARGGQRLVTVGLEPTRPDTGFGYIEAGDALAAGVLGVARFIEKPELARAQEYVRSGRHLWNSGMFFFQVQAILRAIRQHLPELASGLERMCQPGAPASAVAEIFPTLPSISIDHGVMEKADAIAVVPGSFGWSDVGSWQAAWELAPKDPSGNAAPETSVVIDARGNLVCDLSSRSGHKVIAVLGVNDLAIVETDDALLVMPRERAQDVRRVIDTLKQRGTSDKL